MVGVASSVVSPRPSTVRAATFLDYIQQQSPWEQELLEHIDLSDDPFSVGWALSSGIRGVSDGSVWLKTWGAFGWILSDDQGSKKAEGMGPAPGARPNSYRSEAYGMLSLLCFLRRLHEFTGQCEPWVGTLATDSQSLLDTIKGHSPQPEDQPVFAADDQWTDTEQWPLEELSPEWDVVQNIRQLLVTMPHITLEYVRGHQDRRIRYRFLPLTAQLNVDADSRANLFQTSYGGPRPIAPLTDVAGVHLIFPSGTVTANYTAAIRYQATYKPLLTHIRQHYGWSEATVQTVNWKAHGCSIRKNIQKKSHVVKLVQGLLPTNHKEHRKEAFDK